MNRVRPWSHFIFSNKFTDINTKKIVDYSTEQPTIIIYNYYYRINSKVLLIFLE